MTFLRSSWFIRLAALASALATYFYIHSELNTIELEKKSSDPSYKLIKLTSKALPVKVRLATAPPDGYRVVADQVSASPASLIVVGPEALLESASAAETALVDVSESTKTILKRIPIESVAGIHISGEHYVVDVTVPIEKVEG